MKRVRFNWMFLAAFTVVTLAACDQEGGTPVNNAFESDNMIRVSTNDEVTRAGYTTSNLSEFGFFVNTTGKPDYTYNNVRMIKGDDGEWNPEENHIMLWWNAITPVDIVAFAPYQDNKPYTISSLVAVSVKADQRSEENLIASDFIAMKWIDFLPWKDQESGKVPVKFKHLMSRLILKVFYTKDVESEDGSNPITDLKLAGTIRLNGVCNLSQSVLSVTATSSENLNISPYLAEYNKEQRFAVYEAMLIPQNVDILLNVKTEGPYPFDKTYILDMDMRSGYVYTINLLIGKNSIEQI